MSSALEKPLIVVTGATGLQGGSVVKFALKDGGFRIRATTRNVDSPKAKELVAQGVEVVKAHFDDPATLIKAFEGAYGVFGVTNYWDPEVLNADKEIAQGKSLVDAAKAAGVKHFVWSTTPFTSNPVVAHSNSKFAIDEYLKASGVPRTSLYTVMFFENFINFFKITKAEDGSLEGNWPILVSDNRIGAFSASDTGAWVVAAFRNPGEWIGKDLKITGDFITPRKVVATLSEISGKPIKLVEIDEATFENTKNIPQLYELYTNMKFFYNHNGDLGHDYELTKRLHPASPNFDTWAREHIKEVIPA